MDKLKEESPLKEELLPLPGDYSRNELDDLLSGRFFPVIAVATMAAGFAVLEWLSFLLHEPRHPWLATIAAFLIGLGAFLYSKKVRKMAHNHRLGYEGEVFVGQILEGLRVKGIVPIHNVPCEIGGKRFNIDHVLVGPKGVFAVETKARKHIGTNESIDYKNGRLLIGKSYDSSNAIRQIKSNAKYLSDLLGYTGEKMWVYPVLLFPSWFVKPSATAAVENEHEILMLNPKAFGKWIDPRPDILRREQIDQVVMVISKYVHDEISKRDN